MIHGCENGERETSEGVGEELIGRRMDCNELMKIPSAHLLYIFLGDIYANFPTRPSWPG